MRLPKRGEKGFTLIELLIVVAILGVLAAVVIPNVTRFVGAGEQEAAETELHNIQLAVTSMMLENGITTVPAPINEGADPKIVENDMAKFPDITSSASVPPPPADVLAGKVTDPDGVVYDYTTALDKVGYVLYGHDIKAADGPINLVNYVTVDTTTYYYTCEADGTVKQWDINGLALEWD